MSCSPLPASCPVPPSHTDRGRATLATADLGLPYHPPRIGLAAHSALELLHTFAYPPRPNLASPLSRPLPNRRCGGHARTHRQRREVLRHTLTR
ncbi:hypothetical protein BC628DRAFT_377756 [Trametes gibbosa]|nr:hypothetical protein BC628DRAFT_377756 [Trametes gibbosa]